MPPCLELQECDGVAWLERVRQRLLEGFMSAEPGSTDERDLSDAIHAVAKLREVRGK